MSEGRDTHITHHRLVAVTVRSFAVHPLWGSIGSVIAVSVALTVFFAPGTGLLGVIPSFATLEAFLALEAEGTESILTQSIPADAGTPIVAAQADSAMAQAYRDVARAMLARLDQRPKLRSGIMASLLGG